MLKRILAVFLSVTLCISVLPVLSLSSHADNSGFCQIRIFYKTKDSLGNWSSEKSAIITDNSYIALATYDMTVPLQITRLLVRNDSDSLCYFQFDINFGGQIPNNGTWPGATYSSLAFTTNGGVTAYSFDTSDKSNFTYYQMGATGGALPYLLNSSSSRTFFGKVNATGYITFNNPVNITWRQSNSPSNMVYIFFRHVVIGTDNSSYLSNMEQYLSSIDSNVGDIADWMEEEHNMFDSAWSNDANNTYEAYTSNNGGFFAIIRFLFGFNLFTPLWNSNIFSTSNNLFSSWFSQTNSDNINGAARRSPEETEYIDYYSKNQSGELNIFGVE